MSVVGKKKVDEAKAGIYSKGDKKITALTDVQASAFVSAGWKFEKALPKKTASK